MLWKNKLPRRLPRIRPCVLPANRASHIYGQTEELREFRHTTFCIRDNLDRFTERWILYNAFLNTWKCVSIFQFLWKTYRDFIFGDYSVQRLHKRGHKIIIEKKNTNSGRNYKVSREKHFSRLPYLILCHDKKLFSVAIIGYESILFIWNTFFAKFLNLFSGIFATFGVKMNSRWRFIANITTNC